LYERDINSHRC